MSDITIIISVGAAIITSFVGMSTLISNHDKKTSHTTKSEQMLTNIQANMNELRVDVKTGFKDIDRRLGQVENKVSKLESKTDLQQSAIDRAHERIDEIKRIEA